PVQLEEAPAAGPRMEAVDVLGDQGEGGEEGLPAHQGEVRRIGPGSGGGLVTPGVPAPDFARIGPEGLGGGQLFGAHPLPEAAGPPEGVEPALVRHAGAGKGDGAPGRADALADRVGYFECLQSSFSSLGPHLMGRAPLYKSENGGGFYPFLLRFQGRRVWVGKRVRGRTAEAGAGS